jgi:P4 family phage/plasmid primase-like protien
MSTVEKVKPDALPAVAAPQVAVTVLKNSKGAVLAKSYSLDEKGDLAGTTIAQLVNGEYEKRVFKNLGEFVGFLLANVGRFDCAITYGVPKSAHGRITTTSRRVVGAITRTSRNFKYQAGRPGIFLGDIDTDGDPGELHAKICKSSQWLRGVEMYAIPSNSSAVVKSDGTAASKKRKWHYYFIVDDASAIPRILKRACQDQWLAGFGRVKITKSGGRLTDQIFDEHVAQGERLDFCFGPALGDGLTRDPRPLVRHFPGGRLCAADAPPPLSAAEFARVTGPALEAAKDDAARTRAGWLAARGQAAFEASGGNEDARAAEIDRLTAALDTNALQPDFVLYDLDGDAHTVAEILENAEYWNGKTVRDPFEPDKYTDCSKLFLKDQKNWPTINCMAHNRGPIRLIGCVMPPAPPPPTDGGGDGKNTVAANHGEDIGATAAQLATADTATREGVYAQLSVRKAAALKRAVKAVEAQREPVIQTPEDGEIVMSRHTPRDTAKYFRKQFYPNLIHIQDEFLTWKEGAYVEIDENYLDARISAFLDTVLVEVKNPKTGDTFLRPFNPKPVDVDAVSKSLRHVCGLDSTVTRAPSWLEPWDFDASQCISFPNGWLDVRSGQFFEPTPNLFTRNALTFNYDPVAPAPVKFFEFLGQIWPTAEERDEYIPQLQRMMGLLLVPDTSLEKIFIFLGVGGSGKGTLTKLIEKLVGAVNSATAKGRSLVKNDHVLASLRGKTLITLPDLTVPKDIAEDLAELLKGISGQDTQPLNRKNKSVLFEKLPGRILIGANAIPQMPDPGFGLSRRYVPFRFKHSFRDKADSKLGDKLEAELPGVLRWCLDGLRHVQAAPDMAFRLGPLAKAELDGIDEVGNPLLRFVAEHLLIDDDGTVLKDDVYRVYKIWQAQDDDGSKPLSKVWFWRKLLPSIPLATRYQPIGTDGGRREGYRGVRLKS